MITNEKRGDRGSRIMDIMLERYSTTDQEEALREFLHDLLHTGWFWPSELTAQLAEALRNHEEEA